MAQNQRVGLHVSAAGGCFNAPDNAKEVDAECFQFFSRSPQGGGAPEITDEHAQQFREKCEEYGYESYIHTPYYISFASKNNRVRYGSVNVIQEELERGSKLGVKYVNTHLGSAKDFVTDKKSTETPKEALDQVVEGLKKVYETDTEFTSQLVLEIAAGSGSIVGDTFEELAYIIENVGRDDVFVCLDTCHMFAAGYDIRTAEALDATMEQFRKHLGAPMLKLVHANDSKVDINGRADRHEHIGHGYIGADGFKAIFAHPDFQQVNFILETKHDILLAEDLSLLKSLRK